MIDFDEVKVLDINSEFYGTSTLSLMENAGKSVADFILRLKSEYKNLLFLCGTGNNGGDGFVAARYLQDKYNITLFLTGKSNEIKTDISKNNFKKIKNSNINIFDIDSIDRLNDCFTENNIIVDSMLGIGLKGELREPYISIIKKINSLKEKIIISVDMPTGFGTNNAIKPNYTLTFHDRKYGMKNENCGNIHTIDIKIPEKAIKNVGPGELKVYYPRPQKNSHKGENGKVLIIGGGPYIGAPALSGLSALRTGADLVYIATPKKAGRIISTFSPNFIVKDLHSDILMLDDEEIINELVDKSTSVVIGPGLGNSVKTENAIKKIIPIIVDKKIPLVIDADAIQPAGKIINLLKNSKTIITPHREEFKKLTGISLPNDIENKVKIINDWAKKIGAVILSKGPVDIISNGQITKLNIIHNEAMTVGGTGDVLAGIIGALLSKNVEPFNASRIAAFINGFAGNKAFEKKSYGLLATDVIEEIPTVLKTFL